MSKETIKGYSYDEKEDKIGSGSLGTIFRARHIQDPNNEVAIKVIEHNKGPARLMPMELKKREVEICEAILKESHKHLVSHKDYEVKLNTTYLIMEFCVGGDFRGYLEDKKTLSESVIQQFFRQIVSGLKFLHDRNIIHRDLKPENILLSFTGEAITGNRYPTPENIILKIADFGLSRFLSADEVASTECGTFVYMAPEVREGKPYNKEVDVWSIGVMVYECLFGERPKLLYRNSELPAKASKEIRGLLLDLLAPKPQDRPNCDQILAHEFMHDKLNAVLFAMSKETIKGYSYDEKEDEIGRSAFGTIFRARHIQDPNNEVAVKVIEHNRGAARRMPMEFKKSEVEICKAIMNESHKHLVSFKDYEEKSNTTYLIMELCGGGNFRGYLEDKKTLSESVVQQFFRQIVSGLKFLHDRNIVHRNLNPETILLSFTGEVVTGNRYPTPENIILKIGGFGLSSFLSPDELTSTRCGTFAYVAPEVYEGKPYNKMVDIWSIGVMVHECLFGKRPKPLYRNSELSAETSKESQAILKKLMAQKPQDRLSCDQILEHEFMHASSTQTTLATWFRRTFTNRRKPKPD